MNTGTFAALHCSMIDAAHWPDMKERSLAGYQQHCLWMNRNGKFDEIDVLPPGGAMDQRVGTRTRRGPGGMMRLRA